LAAAFELVFAFRDVVANAIAEQIVHGVRLGHVAGALADHEGELDLPVCFLRSWWQLYIIVWADDA